MKSDTQDLISALVLVLIGISLVPIVFTAVEGANWSITVGSNTHDLGFLAYIIALVFGAGVMYLAFRVWKK